MTPRAQHTNRIKSLRRVTPAWCWLCCVAVFAVMVFPARAGEDWWRHFRLGGTVALNIKAQFSMNGQFAVSGSNPGLTNNPVGEHFYDDGYVRTDQTTNAQGYTSFWGYRSTNQISGSQLLMHSTTAFDLSDSGTKVDGGPQPGLDLAYGGTFARLGTAWVGWELGFALLPIEISDKRPISGTFTRTIHAYDTAGIVLPEAPYNGGDSGKGPTIHSTATDAGTEITAGTVTGKRSLDLTLYNIRLGPTLHWELGRYFAVEVSGGGAVGIFTGNYNFNETIVFADGSQSVNQGKIGASEITYGGYASALLMFHTAEQADIYVGAQFMSLGDVQVSGAGRQARLQMGMGVYLSAGINWPF